MRLLIVEPDRILAREYAKSFTQEGFEVIACADAQSAVISCDEKAPDAVLMELQLAGHSGVEFLHEFRSYEDWNDIPVFIYSAIPEYAVGANARIWKSFGVRRFFYKPDTSINQVIGAIKGDLDVQPAI
jgi:CheY-like chemotaxis protein